MAELTEEGHVKDSDGCDLRGRGECVPHCPVLLRKTVAALGMLINEVRVTADGDLVDYLQTNTGIPYLALVLIITHFDEQCGVGGVTVEALRSYETWVGRAALEAIIEHDSDDSGAAAA